MTGRERVHRWWHTKQLSGNVIMGKPSVLFRKLINTEGKDGNLCAVNAQQYAVLVMDVPDLIAEHEKCAQPNLVLQSSAFYGFDTCQQGSCSTPFLLDDFAAMHIL